MAKKNGGLFGGLFDFNGDGKTDLGEEFIAYKIFEECMKGNDDTNDDFSLDDDLDLDLISSKDYSWRSYCEDGSEFCIFPEDYETEEEYEEALNEAKYAWRNTCEDGSDAGIFPDDYETEDEYTEALDEAKHAWRDTCEDGSDLGIDPEDYETEEEYSEALDEAKNRWRDTCDDGADSGVDPDDYETEEEYEQALEEAKAAGGGITLSLSVECPALDKLEAIKESDFPNKRRYNAAYTLANEFICYSSDEYEQREKDCCKFIVEKADTVPAANYLSHEAGFLYSQAIKDNFKLPISLPDEDETREFEFYQAICKIAKKDVPLSFEVWSWALEQFLPYAKYDGCAQADLTSGVISELYSFPDNYMVDLVRYMDKHPDFRQKIADGGNEATHDYANLIVTAIRENLHTTAAAIFGTCLKLAQGQWKAINSLTESTISWCKNYEEVESIEFFRDNLFPLVKAIEIGMVQDEIEGWENEIAEYIDQTEQQSDKYAYSRRYAWRKTVPSGEKYNLDPLYYESEQEYLEALQERKYGWREWYKGRDTLGLNVGDFETQEDFREAFNTRMTEKRQKEREKREAERLQRQKSPADRKENIEDKTIYTICGVAFAHAMHPYNYKTDDPTIKLGDQVLVPVGDSEAVGTVVSVGQFLRIAAPFPIDKMKSIIRKVTDGSDNAEGRC